MGYHRADGQVGTRNYWLVIPLVFCENQNIRALQEAFEKELGISPPETYRRHVADLVKLYREGKTDQIKSYAFLENTSVTDRAKLFPNLDGIRFLTHDMGCGGTRDDAQTLCGLLAGYIHHPNVASTLDLVTAQGELFVVMEYVHGVSLARLLRLASERSERHQSGEDPDDERSVGLRRRRRSEARSVE